MTKRKRSAKLSRYCKVSLLTAYNPVTHQSAILVNAHYFELDEVFLSSNGVEGLAAVSLLGAHFATTRREGKLFY